YRCRLLDRAQHETGIDVGDAAGVEQAVEQETREVLQVADVDVQQVVHVAGQGVAGGNLVPAVDAFDEGFHGGAVVLFQLHAHESLQVQTHGDSIDAGGIAGDDALALQPLHAAQTGRGGQVHFFRQLGIGD